MFKKIRERLDVLTNNILGSRDASPEDFESWQAELKALRELIATHKALAAYEKDYGDDIDDETKVRRVSNQAWD